MMMLYQMADMESLHHFATSRRSSKTTITFMTKWQERRELLRDFMIRFYTKTLEIAGLSVSMLVLLLTVMISVINSNEFKMALALQEPETIWELKKRPERYIQREEVAGTTINRGGKKGQLAKERMGQECWGIPAPHARTGGVLIFAQRRLKHTDTIFNVVRQNRLHPRESPYY